MQTYKDLVVWQKSVDLATAIYVLTNTFPKSEEYGLASQMRRASISIASNIAEGKLRGGTKEWGRFLRMSFASGGELETQIEIAKRLNFVSKEASAHVEPALNEVMRMLNVMISKAKA